MSEARESTVIVTNDPVPAVVDPVTVVAPEQKVEDAPKDPPSDPAGDPAPEQKPSKLQQRFSELTNRAKQEAERAERAERRITELEAKSATSAPAQKTDDGEPKPDNYTDIFKYTSDLAEYKTKQALAARDAEQTKQTQAQRAAEVQKSWVQKMASASAEMPDFDEVVIGSAVTVSDQVRDAVMESDVGPKLLYQMAKDPSIAQRLNAMTVPQAMREIGRMEARIDSPTTAPAKQVEASKAPAPITPIKGGSTKADVPIVDGEFTGTYAQWKEARKGGRVK